MKRQLHPGDVLARLGGDEFAVLIQDVRNRAATDEVAQRMKYCFNHAFECDGAFVNGSASIGIAKCPADETIKDSLLSGADASTYLLKQTRAN